MADQGLHEAWLPRGVDEPPGRRARRQFAGRTTGGSRAKGQESPRRAGGHRDGARTDCLGRGADVAAAISAFPFCSTMVLAISFEAVRGSAARSHPTRGDPREVPVEAWSWRRVFSSSPLAPSLSLVHFLHLHSSYLRFPFSPFVSLFSHPPNSTSKFARRLPAWSKKKEGRPCGKHAVRSVSLLDRAKCPRAV